MNTKSNIVSLIKEWQADLMRIAKYKTSQLLQDALVSHLAESILFDYINISAELTILANEEYYFRTGSDQLNVIIIRREAPHIYIDLIGGGGGSGLLRMNWGSEGAFVRRMQKLLEDFCSTQGEALDLIE